MFTNFKITLKQAHYIENLYLLSTQRYAEETKVFNVAYNQWTKDCMNVIEGYSNLERCKNIKSFHNLIDNTSYQEIWYIYKLYNKSVLAIIPYSTVKSVSWPYQSYNTMAEIALSSWLLENNLEYDTDTINNLVGVVNENDNITD